MVYQRLYNNQINARALIGQSAVGYCASKPTEKSRVFWIIGPLQDPVTWYKITYTGEQVAQWDFQNNAPAFVL